MSHNRQEQHGSSPDAPSLLTSVRLRSLRENCEEWCARRDWPAAMLPRRRYAAPPVVALRAPRNELPTHSMVARLPAFETTSIRAWFEGTNAKFGFLIIQ